MSRRDDLLGLAARVLETEGLEGFGIGSLARAAGVRPPSLYKHFEGLPDLHAALVSRSFASFADAVSAALAELPARAEAHDRVMAFARTYRREALANPQHYRLMTERPLDRDRLEPGAEHDAMSDLLVLFGETPDEYHVARAAWAWAHGLVSLEIAGRYPPGADIEAAWDVLISALSDRAAEARS
ncbi:TetR/AcrR family transcriptional regulator [Microbacterium dauci]|uniref:TetR-like C-terminal domain-containing protein n=1 Tax=Microbacterium dauci TaxID=3048008 RepID=A0ABT6ZAK9_9MICO|nr:TetR-like C-terminal domain-containing protein [Microbacterium sp. LX3-4]MDJ1113193.1 TetR-like C-terminal domain-containing protein [Microbacterium sp. LX3-4]